MNKPLPELADVAGSRPAHILVPTDFSALAKVAVESVLALARNHQELHVTLLNVVEEWHVPDFPDLAGLEVSHFENLSTRRAHAEVEMERVRASEDLQGRLAARVLTGHPARVICEVAKQENFRAIVLSSHGHTGLARVLMGSVAEQVMQDACCPVLVVKPQRDSNGEFIMTSVELKLEKLLVGYDHRAGSKRALAAARAIARGAGAEITLVHAIEPPLSFLGDATQELADDRVKEATAWLREVAGSHQHAPHGWALKVAVGHPWDVIIDTAKEQGSDLVIVGPHEHTRWGHCFIGSTAQRVARLAPCSVLAVK
jgi:nucleotide-binding universal stress UspA family protein